MLKINASKHKSQIPKSQKLSRFSKINLAKNPVLTSLESFLFETFTIKIATKITNSHFGQFYMKSAVFSSFDLLKNCFGTFLNQKIPPTILKSLIHFKPKTNLEW